MTAAEEPELEQGELHIIIQSFVTSAPQLQTIHEDSMETLLAKTHDVFEEPSSLPPPRTLDHSITLKSGTEPFNRRPYRYSYTQKN